MGNLRNAKVRKGILRNDVRNALLLVDRETRISQITRRCCGSGNRCRRLARTPVVRPFITRRTLRYTAEIPHRSEGNLLANITFVLSVSEVAQTF